MNHFGIDFEKGEHVIADGIEIPVEQGQIIAFTGESGSGKSTMLRALAESLVQSGKSVLALSDLENAADGSDEKILVDAIALPFDETLQLLSTCGLGEAHLLLRTPRELSDGQLYRFRLAQALSQRPDWILADEYTATLDRTLAKVISCNLRKLIDRTQIGLLLATTHRDIEEDLNPDLHIHCQLAGEIQIVTQSAGEGKKKDSHSSQTCGFPPLPKQTGRTSLGGIIAATRWD